MHSVRTELAYFDRHLTPRNPKSATAAAEAVVGFELYLTLSYGFDIEDA